MAVSTLQRLDQLSGRCFAGSTRSETDISVDDFDLVAHAAEFDAVPFGDSLGELESAGFGGVRAERTLHLVAEDVVRFGGLLHVHLELDHVEEELQQVLVLGVAA
jgi:hypothetical protein